MLTYVETGIVRSKQRTRRLRLFATNAHLLKKMTLLCIEAKTLLKKFPALLAENSTACGHGEKSEVHFFYMGQCAIGSKVPGKYFQHFFLVLSAFFLAKL
jgi:hypothetical protein